MRDDLHKVVTERPAHGSRAKTPKGSRRRLQRLGEDAPSKVSMEHEWKKSWQNRQFSDLLGPLRRYIYSIVGQKWDDVFSEISKKFPSNNVSYSHVKQHLLWMVETEVIIIDGVPCHKGSRIHGYPLADSYSTVVYVDPTDGIVKKIDKKPRVKYGTHVTHGKTFSYYSFGNEKNDVKEIDGVKYGYIDGIWYELVFSPAIAEYSNYDLMEGGSVSRDGLKHRYGSEVYVTGKRQLGHKALKKLGLNNTLAV